MNRLRNYLSALISIGIGTAAFLILTTLAAHEPLSGEYIDAALFAAFMLSANLAVAYAARFAYRKLPRINMNVRILQAAMLTISFLALLRIDLGLAMDCVSRYTNSGVTVISEMVTMLTWVISFTMVWTAFVEESENAVIAKFITFLFAAFSTVLFFASPLAGFLNIDADYELNISKYALTCLAQAAALSAYLAERRNWQQRVDINRASSEELQQKLPFLTRRQSQGIVEARRHSPYEAVDQLQRAAGMDAQTLKAIGPHARI
ncbi:MAG: ComEA family DNA-binding protein [Eggerthellaceae bacterium]|jgi:hypothetical protein